MKHLTFIALVCGALLSHNAIADNAGQNSTLQVPKDILVEQADFYTISPPTAQNNQYDSYSTAAGGLSVTIWVNHENNTYAAGDNLIIYAKAKRDGYLTMIDIGTSGKVRQLFPNKYQQNNYVRKGQIIQIPAKNANFRYTVAGPAGKELIKAFITSNPGSIYGRSANSFDNSVFPLASANSKILSKDILVELNQHHQGNWADYNKLIYITSGNSGYRPPQSGAQSALQQEQALGLTRAQLRDIQRRLRQMGYYNGSIDGIIGSGTRSAIRALQRASGLAVTGYIDRATFSALNY